MATRIVRFEAGPWPRLTGLRGLILRVVALVIPMANPDLEQNYQQVTHWWLEIDDDDLVRREVGFDSTDRPIAAAPLGTNRGIFTDLDGAPKGLGSEIDPTVFEHVWSEVNTRFRPGTQGGGLLSGAA